MAYNLGQIDPEEPTELYADRRDEEFPGRPRRLLRLVVAVAVMGVFAGGLWFAYKAGMHHSGGTADSANIPLIRADTRPIKVKPENPGGMQIPDRDMLIYGQRPGVEHLLPPPEEPMARPAPPPPPPAAVAPPPPAETAVVASPPTAPAAPAMPSAASAAAAPPTAPPAPAISSVAISSADAEPSTKTPPPTRPAPTRPALSPAAAAAARELGLTPAEIWPKSPVVRTVSAKAGPVRRHAQRE
jgi:hypothetical protein